MAMHATALKSVIPEALPKSLAIVGLSGNGGFVKTESTAILVAKGGTKLNSVAIVEVARPKRIFPR